MTPNAKDKAEELMVKFFLPLNVSIDVDIVGKRKELAKQHALLCVEELYKNTSPVAIFRIQYWKDVKSEIEKL